VALLAKRVGLIDTENAFKVGPYIRLLEEQGKRVIKCNLGEPDFPIPQLIKDEVKRQIDLDQTHYCDPQGILPLREAVARAVGPRRGLSITPDRVVVFPGGKPPIGLAQQTYCNPGDEVIYPSPGFPIYESFTAYLGLKPVPLVLKEERDFSFDGKDLAPLITDRTRLIILNFPSNPTGGVATREQLEDIADAIKRLAPAHTRIFSDEIYESRLHSHPSCANQDTGLGTGLRWLRADHSGRSTESEEEAEIVQSTVLDLLGTTWTDKDGVTAPITFDDVMVVAPYNDQVALIKQTLEADARTRGIRVGTVDKFQGREAPVVFFTMTASSAANVPRGPEFLFSRNRLISSIESWTPLAEDATVSAV